MNKTEYGGPKRAFKLLDKAVYSYLTSVNLEILFLKTNIGL